MAEIKNIQEVLIRDLRPYEKNARLHSEEQVQKIAESIKAFGFLNPCIIDKDNNVLAGHGRIMAGESLGLESVPCVYVEGLTEEERKAYILADNRLAEMSGWDMELVSSELQELKEGGYEIDLTGFSIDNIIIEDDFGEEEVPEETYTPTEHKVQKGDVWQLGEHRLMCGDSTDINDVEKLMDDNRADLLLTDPPYNVDLGGVNKVKTTFFGQEYFKGANTDDIANDALPKDEFIEFLANALNNANYSMKEGAAFYVWYGETSTKEFIESLSIAELPIHQNLIWVKNQHGLGMSDYQWRHEACYYGWKSGGTHYFINLRSQDTTLGTQNIDTMSVDELRTQLKNATSYTDAIFENKPLKNKEHPTMKPVSLFKKLIRNSSKSGWKVLDLFGGSGTTLLACEEMDRKCYMMEYDPKYCDVIINRWEELTGQKAVLL